VPTNDDLHARLEAISAKIDAARGQMELKHGLNDGHNLASGELKARYKFLKSALDEHVASLEAHGHHVSALEQDAMAWIKSIDMDLS
jgi:hypothetical protein